MKVLFIIPARGGSKGLPGKNIKLLNNKPLIAYSIEAALSAAAQIGDSEVVVSTDSESIAKIAKDFGAKVPFIRPEELSNDTAASIDVMLHALQIMEQEHQQFEHICMVEPTSPQRDGQDLYQAYLKLIHEPEAESIVGVSKTEGGHPLFLTHLKNGFLDPYANKSYKVYRRQEIDEVYFFEGSMYISKVNALKKRKSFYHEKTLGYEMPKWKAFEIDDATDFLIIERLIQAKQEGLIQ
jgi:CMP-N,N'-diacetyllegionaminic acid synthase